MMAFLLVLQVKSPDSSHLEFDSEAEKKPKVGSALKPNVIFLLSKVVKTSVFSRLNFGGKVKKNEVESYKEGKRNGRGKEIRNGERREKEQLGKVGLKQNKI